MAISDTKNAEVLHITPALPQTLAADIKTQTPVHAYIFEGAEGLGKRSCAAYFVSALLCTSEIAPCKTCAQCVQLRSGNNPDIKSLSLADITTRKTIGADDIRNIISDCYIRPFAAKYKVYIIEDGDTLTPQAQNALLKILEEPPAYVIFIICTTNTGFILPTVLSRSRVVKFAVRSDIDIQRYIASAYPHMAGNAAFIASLCGGIPAKADALCGSGEILALRGETLGMLEKLLVGINELQIFEAAQFIDNYKSEGGDISLILDFMLALLNDMLKLKSGVIAGLSNSDLAARLGNTTSRCEAAAISGAADSVCIAQQMLRRNVSQRSTVLAMLIGISGQ